MNEPVRHSGAGVLQMTKARPYLFREPDLSLPWSEFGDSISGTGAGESIEDWKQFVRLGSPGAWEVFFFVAHGDVDKVRTCTDEEIEVHCTCLLEVLPVLPNLRWLIPMAMSLSHGESADSFEVQEIRSKQPE